MNEGNRSLVPQSCSLAGMKCWRQRGAAAAASSALAAIEEVDGELEEDVRIIVVHAQ